MTPLSLYIDWLKAKSGEPRFPEQCKDLSLNTIMNLATDDLVATIALDQFVNNDINTYHSIDVESVAKMHKRYNKCSNFSYISIAKKTDSNEDTLKEIMLRYPYLKKDEVKMLVCDKDFMKSVGKNAVKPLSKKDESKSNPLPKKEVIIPEVIDDKNQPMLVDVYYKYDRDTRESECSYVTRIGKKKIIETSDDFVDLYYGSDTYKNVRVIDDKLRNEKIRFGLAKFKIDELHQKGFAVYAGDIDIGIRKSVEWKEHHPNQGTYKIRINYVDIELFQKGYGVMDFSDVPGSAEKIPINLITLYDNYDDVYHTFIYNMHKAEVREEQIREYLEYNGECKLDVKLYDTEKEMLKAFFELLIECDADILTGWNTDGFDLPFLYHRCKTLGVEAKLAHDKILNVELKVKVVKDKRKNKTDNVKERSYYSADLGYMVSLDYLPLYKKRSISIKDSYTLNNIANIELGIKKLNVSEGMDEIFETNPSRFIAYNINDVHLVRKLDDKLKYIDLSFSMVQFSNIRWSSLYTTLHICDGILYEYLYKNGKTVKVVEKHESQTKNGAFVRKPIKGIHEYAGDLDATSMYPYIMARYNISADTYVGKFDVQEHAHMYMYERDEFDKLESIPLTLKVNGVLKHMTTTPSAVEKFMETKGHILTHVGTMFCKHEVERSVLYDIIDMLIKMRKKYKDLMKENIGKDKMLYDRYDGMQKTVKIITNSLYGGQANVYFRLYSYEVAESITGTGREMIKLAAVEANKCINHMAINDPYTYPKLEFKKGWITEAEGTLDNVIYGDSVTGNSLINTEKYGTIPINTLYDLYSELSTNIKFTSGKEELIYFKEPLKVKTENGYCNVDNIMRHRTKKHLYRITDEFGNSIDVTEDHSIMVKRNGTLIQIKPTEIMDGDLLIIDEEE